MNILTQFQIDTFKKLEDIDSDILFQDISKLYHKTSLPVLMAEAHKVRTKMHNDNVVTYLIDRNINITNVCFSFCSFCNFCTSKDSENAFITNIDQYKEKIEELYALGGNQVLLQGGMHPDLGLSFYTDLFKELKKLFPDLYIHSLSPSEIYYLSKKETLSITQVLLKLKEAGLDSLPGGGAEILDDEIRKKLSPLKVSAFDWLNVMQLAQQLDIDTTATMMFGHIETIEQRLNHILLIRQTQSRKPSHSAGFSSFIPWTFQANNTRLQKETQKQFIVRTHEYLKTIAIARIVLQNVPNIQASWLTAGLETAMLSLHAGANDLGSIMLEENVVASTGLKRKMSIEQIETLITESGFIPKKRNQKFEYL